MLEIHMKMPALQNPDCTWILAKDLQKKKFCSQCHQPMTVKQLSLTEACRTCFNGNCTSKVTVIPEVEYIQRSYKDMEYVVTNAEGFSNPPLSLEEEVQEINTFFSEIQSLVSHKLSAKLKNELELISCSGNKNDNSHCSDPPQESPDLKDNWHTMCLAQSNIGPTIPDSASSLTKQPTNSNGAMCVPSEVLESDFLKFEEESQSSTGNNDIILNEQRSGNNLQSFSLNTYNTLDDIVSSVSAKKSELGQNEHGLCESESKTDSYELQDILENEKVLGPESCQTDDILNSGGLTDWFDSVLDCKDNFPSLDDLATHSSPMKCDVASDETKVDQVLPNKVLHSTSTEDSNKYFSDIPSQTADDSKNDTLEDFNVKVQNTYKIRCYPSRKARQPTVKAKTNNLSAQLDVTQGTLTLTNNRCINLPKEFESSASRTVHYLDNEDELCVLFSEYDTQENCSPTPKADPSGISEMTILDKSISPKHFEGSSEPDHNLKANRSPPKSTSALNFVVTLQDQGNVSVSLAKTDPQSSVDIKKNSPPKTMLSRRNNPTKKKEASKPQISNKFVADINKGSIKGFSELRLFGGCKSSLPPPKLKVSKKCNRAKKQPGKEQKCVIDASEDLEKALSKEMSNVQQSSTNQSSLLEDLLSDLL